jgi:mannan endo-1,4-beta-mannosidase
MKNIFPHFPAFKNKALSLFLLVFVLLSFNGLRSQSNKLAPLVDKKATASAILLSKKLQAISKQGFAVGHQDASSYGIGWKHKDHPEKFDSDVHRVLGDFPAVFGFDIGGIELDSTDNLDSVPFDNMRKLIIDAHAKGGIITISWHLDNPVSGGDSWDKTPAVAQCLKGGAERVKYELWVKRVANFLNALEYKGEKIPVIFRPFHEMNGAWFWWGDPNCTSMDYISLWQDTVEQLRDVHQVHHLLYAYSPNKLNPGDEYLKYYPGDDFVDIFGVDIYDRNDAADYIKSVKQDVVLMKSIADKKNKLYAFTETGLEKIPTEKWFTEVLYPAIENSGISWVLMWRNHRTSHHYMPFKGHPSEKDFKNFKDLPKTLFLNDINQINH